MAVAGREDVGAQSEGLPENSPDMNEESTAVTRARCLLSQRDVGATRAIDPTVSGFFATLSRQDPTSPEPQIAGDKHHVFVRFLLPQRRPTRRQPGVVVRRRQNVADTDVTGLEAISPRHPRRREQRIRTWQVDDLIDRHDSSAWHARHRHRPAPPGIAGQQALEQVSDHALVRGVNRQMLSYRSVADYLDSCRPRDIDRSRSGRIEGESCHLAQPSIWSATARNIFDTLVVSAG